MAKATDKSKKIEADIEEVREAAQTYLVSQLAPKTFSSGKTGFFAQGKVVIGEDRFQAQIQLVKIEPKK
jgi:hypothetical protein